MLKLIGEPMLHERDGFMPNASYPGRRRSGVDIWIDYCCGLV
jgi:hypothetical protein